MNLESDFQLISKLSETPYVLDGMQSESMHKKTAQKIVMTRKFGQEATFRKFNAILKELHYPVENIRYESRTQSISTAAGSFQEQFIQLPIGISEDHHRKLCAKDSLVGTYGVLRRTIDSSHDPSSFTREKLTICEEGDKIKFTLEIPEPGTGMGTRTYDGYVTHYRHTLTLIGYVNDPANSHNSMRIITLPDEGSAGRNTHSVRWGLLTTGILGTSVGEGWPISRRILLEKPELNENGGSIVDITPTRLTRQDIDEIYGDLAEQVLVLVGSSDLKGTVLRKDPTLALEDAMYIDQALIDSITSDLAKRITKPKPVK